jgi:hypothetical protein
MPLTPAQRYNLQQHKLRDAAAIVCDNCSERTPVWHTKYCDGCSAQLCIPCWNDHNGEKEGTTLPVDESEGSNTRGTCGLCGAARTPEGWCSNSSCKESGEETSVDL